MGIGICFDRWVMPTRGPRHNKTPRRPAGIWPHSPLRTNWNSSRTWGPARPARAVALTGTSAVCSRAEPENPSNPAGMLKAAFSTMTLPGIFSSVANKFLLSGFTAVESTWQSIAATRSVSDFKAITSYRLTGGFDFEEIGPGGELKHGEIGEESFQNQARTYGRMFSLTRQDLINDDLGALTAVPSRIGRGAALTLNKVFWQSFLDNGGFFTTARKNYKAGATTAMSLDSLTEAELLFLTQTDPDGNPLALTPSILLVPPALLVPSTLLMNSTEVRNPSAKDVTCSASSSRATSPTPRFRARARRRGTCSPTRPNSPPSRSASSTGSSVPSWTGPRPTSTCSVSRCGATSTSGWPVRRGAQREWRSCRSPGTGAR